MAYQPNPGRIPPECIVTDEHDNVRFRSVHVRLFGGIDSKARGDAPWPSGGSSPAAPDQWKISRPPHKFEIEQWELAQ